MESLTVVPVDPVQGGVHDVGQGGKRAILVGAFGLVKPVYRLG